MHQVAQTLLWQVRELIVPQVPDKVNFKCVIYLSGRILTYKSLMADNGMNASG